MKTAVYSKKSKSTHFVAILLILTAIISLIFAYFAIKIYNETNLDIELLENAKTKIEVFDNNNNLIKTNNYGYPYVEIKDINRQTINAFTSIEDKEFYTHNGINFKRIISAFVKDLSTGKIKEGASTITQQLIKNTHLTNEKTIARKVKEIILASKLERQIDKNKIMELYLNSIYYGNSCYGIESASRFYFGKNASDLDINESAILAGIIKSPAYYSPLTNKEKILTRKNLVLDEMFEDGHITIEELKENKKRGLDLTIDESITRTNSAYINNAITEVCQKLNITESQLISKKYKIFTYFDEKISQNLASAVKHNTNAQHNAIIVDNKTNGIVAFNSSYPNNAINIKRMPASTIKPLLVYAPALEYKKIYTCSILDDNPTTFDNDYTPKNISNKYYGKISATDAVAKSLNVPAVKLFEETGIEKCKSFARKNGITFDKTDNGLALALGSMKYGITINELVSGYSTFANKGFYNKSTFIKKITDKNGKIIYIENKILKKVMSEETAYLIGQMMKQTSINGTCKALNTLDFETHSKTGTNGSSYQDYDTDSICVAQTTEHTACIWYFSEDYKKENLLENQLISQLSPTLKIKELFSQMYKNNKPKDFERPQNVQILKLDAISYEQNKIELATENTPDRYTIECEFCSDFLPQVTSKNFTQIDCPKLTFTRENDKITLSFNALRHQKYELFKEYKNSNSETITEKLLTINNESKNASYTDILANQNANYIYYIIVSNTFTNQKAKSNTVELSKSNENHYNFFNYFS